MKRYQFPLERVWRWREEQAELEGMKLEVLFGELSAIQEQRRQLLAQRTAAERILDSGHPVSAEEFSRLDSFRQYVHARCISLDHLHRQQETKIAKQRERVVEAGRQFEILDRFREKSLQQWRAGNDREQEALASELFLARRKRPSPLP